MRGSKYKILHLIIQGKIIGKRTVGRRRISWPWNLWDWVRPVQSHSFQGSGCNDVSKSSQWRCNMKKIQNSILDFKSLGRPQVWFRTTKNIFSKQNGNLVLGTRLVFSFPAFLLSLSGSWDHRCYSSLLNILFRFWFISNYNSRFLVQLKIGGKWPRN